MNYMLRNTSENHTPVEVLQYSYMKGVALQEWPTHGPKQGWAIWVMIGDCVTPLNLSALCSFFIEKAGRRGWSSPVYSPGTNNITGLLSTAAWDTLQCANLRGRLNISYSHVWFWTSIKIYIQRCIIPKPNTLFTWGYNVEHLSIISMDLIHSVIVF